MKARHFRIIVKKNNLQHFTLPFSGSLDWRTALALKRICREYNADIIHLHSSKSHSIAILSAVLGNQTPLILSRRVDFVPKSSIVTKWKYNHSSIKKILCVSDKIAEIMRAYVRDKSKIVTVHSGVDRHKYDIVADRHALRREFNLSDSTRLIGNTSALEAHKDYFTFIDTVKYLKSWSFDFHAFIIGDGSLKKTLEQYAIDNGVASNITFTGFRKDLLTLLPSLDLFLMTSNEEGLGTSILDAFAAHVPVVATNAGGIPEMIKHKKTGMLAEIGDAQKLADFVKQVLSDATLKQQLLSGASAMLENFSKEKTATKTLAQYKLALDRN